MLLTKYVAFDYWAIRDHKQELLEAGYKIKQHYDSKHKRFACDKNQVAVVPVSMLSNGSHQRVDVQCDYCGKVKNVAYKDYVNNHDDKFGDCCHKCQNVKCKNTLKELYGINHPYELEEFREKAKETNRKNCGHDWFVLSERSKEICKEGVVKKYGVECAFFNKEILQKALKNHKHYNISKPQKFIYDTLVKSYGSKNVNIEHQFHLYSMDILLNINDMHIDIEYDGSFWHEGRNEHDSKRDDFMIEAGYKVLRLKAAKRDKIPDNISAIIKEAIVGFANTDKIVIEL